MQKHLTDSMATHLLLQSQFYKYTFAAFESKLKHCEQKIAELEAENAALKLATQSTALKLDEMNSNIEKCNGDITTLSTLSEARTESCRSEGKFYLEELEKAQSLTFVAAPLQFTIHSVSTLQKSGEKWLSLPFYTHAQGYRMCLKVYPGGHSTSAGTDMSLYVCIMKGPYDNKLKWPFIGTVVIKLLDLAQDKEHIIRTVSFHKTVTREYSGQVTNGEMSGGWGILKFASLNDLAPKFLWNDSLQIAIDKVQLFCD
jgi:hypothetical protein